MSIIKKLFEKSSDIIKGDNLSVDEIKMQLAKNKASEMFYEKAMSEIAEDNKKPGIWAQAMTEANFDENSARQSYMKIRVASLQDEAVEMAIKKQEQAIEKQELVQKFLQKQEQELLLKQKLRDFTFIDKNTNLMWKRHHEPNKMDWDKAMDYAKNHEFAGYDDWHLPSIDELKTIVKKSRKPTIDSEVFPNTPADIFWSSTPSSNNSSNAWWLGFISGYNHNDCRTNSYYIRLVRAGE
ncbi:MAG: hypothetical protein DRQ51_04400 [Gammaproteobacteria bacterium]|nr:MAG: hypothetical protein DRQ51_04400 [Gammaproteobacteria bacterium]